jgi:phosphate transport system protein
MQRHLEEDLDGLKSAIIRMASSVEQAVGDSLLGLTEARPERIQSVFHLEDRINAFEVEIDDLVVDLLALRQPVAADLRMILAALKINNDLERIGDHAVNIAESARSFQRVSPPVFPAELRRMAATAQTMLRDAVDGFVHNTPSLCGEVLRHDDVVDNLNRTVVRHLADLIRRDPEGLEPALQLMRVSRNLERIADHATNIAEEVIFMADARVVKHGAERDMRGQGSEPRIALPRKK